MKQWIILILLLTSGLAIKSLGAYEARYVLAADTYTVEVPQVLSRPIIIDNRYNAMLMPRITINGQARTIAMRIDVGQIQESIDAYSFAVEHTQDSVYISERVTFTGDEISSHVTIRNNAAETKNTEVTFELSSGQRMTLFSPATYRNATDNYVIIGNENMRGLSLAVISSLGIGPEVVSTQFTKTTYFPLTNTVALRQGDTFDMTVRYKPILIYPDAEYNYPEQTAAHLEEPLVHTIGSTDKSITDAPGRTTELLARLGVLQSTDSSFLGMHDVDLSSMQQDSLGAAMVAKKVCINSGIPCKEMISKKDKNYYAWLQIYDGQWQNINPYAGNRDKPEGYTTFYEEPTPPLFLIPAGALDEETFYKSFASLGGTSLHPSFIFLVALAIIGVGLVYLMKYKSKQLFGRGLGNNEKAAEQPVQKQPFGFGKPAEKEVEATKPAQKQPELILSQIDGKYTIINANITDYFMKEVLQKIQQKNGNVVLDEFVRDMHYSPELIKYAIKYMHDQGNIKKEGIPDFTPEETKKRLPFFK